VDGAGNGVGGNGDGISRIRIGDKNSVFAPCAEYRSPDLLRQRGHGGFESRRGRIGGEGGLAFVLIRLDADVAKFADPATAVGEDEALGVRRTGFRQTTANVRGDDAAILFADLVQNKDGVELAEETGQGVDYSLLNACRQGGPILDVQPVQL